MNCDKCGGLLVVVDADEIKCSICSKRTYREGVVNELATVHQMPIATERRCQKILAVAGTQCKTDVVHGTTYCKRHTAGSDGLVPNDIEPGKRSKTFKEQVAAWDEKHTPTKAVTVTRETTVKVSTPSQEKPIPYLTPMHVSFNVSLNDPANWIAFGRTWQDCYKGYTIAECEYIDEEGRTYTIVLEQPQQGAP